MVRVEGLEDVDDLVYVLDRVIEAVEPGRLLGRHVRRAGGRLFVDGGWTALVVVRYVVMLRNTVVWTVA
jgi:hypothetical protein